MGLSHRVTELLESWLGDRTIRPKVETMPSPSTGLSTADTVVTVTTTATEIVPANPNRLTVQIQNHGLVPVLIKVGANPVVVPQDFNFILTQASDVRLGDGGVSDFITSKLSIIGITESSTADISVLEEVI
jgi:hypothetical protein